MGFLRQYLLAVRSFTRVPVTGSLAQWLGASADLGRASAAHWPGVGWLVGVAACAAFALVGLVLADNPFAPMAAAVAGIAASALLTGSTHETAFARLFDAAHGRAGIGSAGVLALVLAVLGKVALLAVLAAHSPAAVLAALVAAQVTSRFWPLLLARGASGADPASGEPLAQPVGARALGIAAAWSAPALAVAWFAQDASFVILAVAVSGLTLLGMRKRFASGAAAPASEALGATQQACELAFYLGAAIGLRAG